jgi:hypothetical protein
MPTARTPYTDSAIAKRIINAMVDMVDWTQAPTIKRFGLNMEDRMKFENWPPGGTKKVEWMDDSMSATKTTLSANISAVDTATCTVADGTLFHTGHVIKINNEVLTVEGVSGNTLTIARGAGGSTAATHTSGDTVTILTIAKKTMEDFHVGHTTNMNIVYNYTQILEESIQVAKDQQIAKDYGVDDTMAYHLGKLIGGSENVGGKGRAGALTLRLAQTFYSGLRQQPSASARGMMGGVPTYITNSLGATTTALSRDTIHKALREVYDNGGMPDLILCSSWGAEVINGLYEELVRTERSEQRGGSTIRYIDTPVVENVEILIDWMCPADTMYVLDSEKLGWATVRPFEVTDWFVNGDYSAKSVLGEYTFIVRNGTKSHRVIRHKAT